MKKIVPFLLLLCLMLTACAKVENKAGDTNDVPGSAVNSGVSDTAVANEAQEGPTASKPIMLFPAYIQTPLGQPVELEAETYPAGKKLIWTSSDPSIAVVDAAGCVTPVGMGATVVECAFADDADVNAFCGVSVTADGNLFFWEYWLESIDMDAAIAMAEAETEGDLPELEWPGAWPSDIPKISGAVVDVYGDGPQTADGLAVTVASEGMDVPKAYVDKLVSLGFKAKEVDSGESNYYVLLTGNGYDVDVYYAGMTNQCTVQVKR